MSSSSSTDTTTPLFFDELYTPKTIAKGGCFCCEYAAWEFSKCEHCLTSGEEGDDCDCGCDYPRCEESAGGCKHYLGDYIKPVAEAEPEPQAAPAPVAPLQPPLVRVQLRRSYGVVPGQSDSDREAMIAELDILNGQCKVAAAAAPAAAAAASPSPTKRSLDDYPDAPKKAAKKARKRRIQAVAKNIGGEDVYELTLADGSIILARPLRFA